MSYINSRQINPFQDRNSQEGGTTARSLKSVNGNHPQYSRKLRGKTANLRKLDRFSADTEQDKKKDEEGAEVFCVRFSPDSKYIAA
eukprot:48890-Amorphochlora_amoeboformis.AAC.1